MPQTEQITFYTYPYSPCAHRAHIALAEAGATYTSHIVNLSNKPAWYAAKVNPSAEVPSLTYGGPRAPPPHSSASSSAASPRTRSSLLPRGSNPGPGFAVGEWSSADADAAAAPFLARMWVLLESEIGKYPYGKGKATLDAL